MKETWFFVCVMQGGGGGPRLAVSRPPASWKAAAGVTLARTLLRRALPPPGLAQGWGTEEHHLHHRLRPRQQPCLAHRHRRECPAIERTTSWRVRGRRPHEAEVALFGSGDATARWSSSWWWATSPPTCPPTRGWSPTSRDLFTHSNHHTGQSDLLRPLPSCLRFESFFVENLWTVHL